MKTAVATPDCISRTVQAGSVPRQTPFHPGHRRGVTEVEGVAADDREAVRARKPTDRLIAGVSTRRLVNLAIR